MTARAFTLFHVVLSLLGILSGFVVMFGLLKQKPWSGWTAFFLATTIATSVTGFGFPFEKFGPPHFVGIISLVVLAIALVALYAFHAAGAWRWVYAISAVAALYFNVFVGVVQAFENVPALNALAPKQTEPPFAIAQLVVLGLFIWLGVKVAAPRRAGA